MKREIRFRAWTNNCWINGGMIYDFQDTTYFGIFGFDDDDLIIMQLTGLKDKNGKDIYEGDILDCGDRICLVVWHIHSGQWDLNFIKYKGILSSNGIDNINLKYRSEVIGNFCENRELLDTTN